MGLHSPLGYVGYIRPMAKTIIDLIERFCSACHTNNDYDKGCKGCPVGQLIYEARDYILTSQEEDKHFAEYASDEWQEKIKKAGRPEESKEERDKWARMAKEHHAESVALRGMKKILKQVEPHPFFYAQSIWDRKRNPDPLLKFREYLKDFEFYENRWMDDFKISSEINSVLQTRLKEELAQFLGKKEVK